MAYTYSPDTDRGKIRLLIHDNTDGVYGTDYDFTDADIDALLEINGDSIWLSASEACRILAVKAMATAYTIKIPGAFELDKKQVSARYMQMARDFEARASSSSDNIVEYFDSFDYEVDTLGQDNSEYVGDV